ncbi:MAG: TetR/AcrR family transcriptional regulator [Dermatophilaceae bacterium]
MRESATKVAAAVSRRVHRQRTIHMAACRLVIERGYDGFTMDDLAEAVGVSRRTLFNHVPDKASAVLGVEEGLEHEAIDTFLQGGPTGHLVRDVLHVADTVLASEIDADGEGLALHRLREQAVASDPKLLKMATEAMERLAVEAAAALCTREGWPEGDLRARALSATLLALVDLALREFSAQPQTGTIQDAFRRVVAAYDEVRASP